MTQTQILIFVVAEYLGKKCIKIIVKLLFNKYNLSKLIIQKK